MVHALAKEFEGLELVMNGGVGGMNEVVEHLERDGGDGGAADRGDARGGGGAGDERAGLVHGVMVGRAAINHPCAFAGSAVAIPSLL